MTGLPYRKAIKPRLPKHWFDELPHTHVALDDAIEQGALFCNMLAELRAAQEAAAARTSQNTDENSTSPAGDNAKGKNAPSSQ